MAAPTVADQKWPKVKDLSDSSSPCLRQTSRSHHHPPLLVSGKGAWSVRACIFSRCIEGMQSVSQSMLSWQWHLKLRVNRRWVTDILGTFHLMPTAWSITRKLSYRKEVHAMRRIYMGALKFSRVP